MRTMTLHGPRGESVKPRPREGLRLLSSTAGGSREKDPHQMEFSPQTRQFRASQGPGSRGAGAARGPGTSLVRDLAAHSRSHQVPGQVDGLRHGLQGLSVTHQVPLVGEEGARDLSSGDRHGAEGLDGKAQGAGAVSGPVTSGVITPCLSPSLAPCCPRSRVKPSLGSSASSPCPSAAATRASTSSRLSKATSLRSIESPSCLLGGPPLLSPASAGGCLWEPSDSLQSAPEAPASSFLPPTPVGPCGQGGTGSCL